MNKVKPSWRLIHFLVNNTFSPVLFTTSVSTRRKRERERKKYCFIAAALHDSDSITAAASQTGASCLRVLIHLHSEVTRRRVLCRAVFLYLLNKILDAPSSTSHLSPTMRLFHLKRSAAKGHLPDSFPPSSALPTAVARALRVSLHGYFTNGARHWRN